MQRQTKYSQFYLLEFQEVNNILLNFHFKWEGSASQRLCDCVFPEIPINWIRIDCTVTLHPWARVNKWAFVI